MSKDLLLVGFYRCGSEKLVSNWVSLILEMESRRLTGYRFNAIEYVE